METKNCIKQNKLLILKEEPVTDSTFRKRAQFYGAQKLRNETVTEYYLKLLNLSINCQFDDDIQERIICDKFIIGFRSGQIFDLLCSQHKNISLKDALNLALKCECEIISSRTKESIFKQSALKDLEVEILDIKPDPLECLDVSEIAYPFDLSETRAETTLICYLCNLSFGNLIECQQHISNHFHINGRKKKSAKFFCDICGKTCDRRHFLIHSNDKKFKCTTCEKSFNSSTNCRAHMQSHNPNCDYKCDICNRAFKQKRHLRQHLDVHFGEKKCKCNICGQMFRLKATLNNHVRLHETSKLKCESCKLTFRDRNKYVEHIQKHVNVKKQCEICGKTVKYMKAHMDQHNSPRNHECSFCGKKFVRRQELVAHEKLHTGLNCYPCHICEKKFNRENSLKAHLIRHTSKDFACEICGKTFYRNDELGRHILTHSDAKNFKCDFCDTLFTCNRSKLRHLRNKHPQE